MTEYAALARAAQEAYARFLRGDEDESRRVPVGPPGPASRQARAFSAGFAAGVRYAEEHASQT